jgi:hypothetical protein
MGWPKKCQSGRGTNTVGSIRLGRQLSILSERTRFSSSDVALTEFSSAGITISAVVDSTFLQKERCDQPENVSSPVGS